MSLIEKYLHMKNPVSLFCLLVIILLLMLHNHIFAVIDIIFTPLKTIVYRFVNYNLIFN